jgi:hypothetical protein
MTLPLATFTALPQWTALSDLLADSQWHPRRECEATINAAGSVPATEVLRIAQRHGLTQSANIGRGFPFKFRHYRATPA